jgi:Rod binding domain-containing protein
MTNTSVQAVSQAPIAQLRQATDKLVGSLFYGTLLRQMRSSVLKGPYGHGGRGEEVFAGQLDQLFAERMGESRTTNLTDAVVRRYGEKAERMELYRAEADESRGGG